MQTAHDNVFLRSDTLLGVCEALGQDFGVNPLFLRLGFGLLLFWNIGAALAIYLVLGAAVLASRLFFPRRAAAAPEPVAPLQGDNDEDLPELARAA